MDENSNFSFSSQNNDNPGRDALKGSLVINFAGTAAELTADDGDNYGWIDENDAVYSRLRIWAKTASGDDQLIALGAKEIGALYLGRIDTPLSIKDSSNVLQGQVRATGIFLREEGGVGGQGSSSIVSPEAACEGSGCDKRGRISALVLPLDG